MRMHWTPRSVFQDGFHRRVATVLIVSSTTLNLNFASSVNVLYRTIIFPSRYFFSIEIDYNFLFSQVYGSLALYSQKARLHPPCHCICNGDHPLSWIFKILWRNVSLEVYNRLLSSPFSLAATRESDFFPSVPLMICLSSRILSRRMTLLEE